MEGEKLRQRLGIDGTMGDAQDVKHVAHQSLVGSWCAICGFSMSSQIHVKPPRTENVETSND